MKLPGNCTWRGIFGGAAAVAALLALMSPSAAPQGMRRTGVATFFGPVSVNETQALKACLHNVAAPGRVKVKWTLLDNSSSRVAEAERTSVVDPATGACELFQPTVAKTAVVMLEVSQELPDAANGQHIPGTLPSLQVTDRGGTSAIALLVPAVQKVREASKR
ncbi:MAG: hypothetical protein IH602_06725 [Bryobacteraceae bacterium]|nr:hypothetical protein [Bryobacteraceae bacterium]